MNIEEKHPVGSSFEYHGRTWWVTGYCDIVNGKKFLYASLHDPAVYGLELAIVKHQLVNPDEIR